MTSVAVTAYPRSRSCSAQRSAAERTAPLRSRSIDSTTRSISKSSIVTLYAPLPGAAASLRQSCSDSRACCIVMPAVGCTPGARRCIRAHLDSRVLRSRARDSRSRPANRARMRVDMANSILRPTGRRIDASAKPVQTILIVDDYEDNRQMYGELLSYAGYAVVEACNGAEGIAKAHELLPDLIVMDLSLPVIDGWE